MLFIIFVWTEMTGGEYLEYWPTQPALHFVGLVKNSYWIKEYLPFLVNKSFSVLRVLYPT